MKNRRLAIAAVVILAVSLFGNGRTALNNHLADKEFVHRVNFDVKNIHQILENIYYSLTSEDEWVEARIDQELADLQSQCASADALVTGFALHRQNVGAVNFSRLYRFVEETVRSQQSGQEKADQVRAVIQRTEDLLAALSAEQRLHYYEDTQSIVVVPNDRLGAKAVIGLLDSYTGSMVP